MDCCERLLHESNFKIKDNSIIDKVLQKYNDFMCRNYGKEPSKLLISKVEFDNMLNEIICINNYNRTLIPKTCMGMEIEIDDRVKEFEVIGYREFLGLREVIR